MKPLRTICITAVPFLLLGTYYFAGNIAAPDIQTRFEISGTLRNASFVDPNPYAMFGSDAVLLMTEHELDVDHKLQITDDKTGNLWEMDMQTGSVATYDKDGVLIAEKQLNSREMARWLTLDRFAEKYYSMSPYSFAAGNPIRYIDINGDSLWISHKGQSYLYENRTLYLNGGEYTGKVTGFLKQTVNSLNDIAGGGLWGNTLVSGLQVSENNYTITYNSGRNAFEPSSITAAMGNLPDYQDMTGNFAGSTGSGGIILFDPYTQSSGFNTAGTTHSPAYSSLAHEMTHASDANHGILNYTGGDPHGYSYTNPVTGLTYNPNYNGLNISEWRAVYVENQIRSYYGAPLRTHYGINNGAPTGPRLLDAAGRPIYK